MLGDLNRKLKSIKKDTSARMMQRYHSFWIDFAKEKGCPTMYGSLEGKVPFSPDPVSLVLHFAKNSLLNSP